MPTLPEHPTERDRERFRDTVKSMGYPLEYARCGQHEAYSDAITHMVFEVWWKAERERQLLQNLNRFQGLQLTEWENKYAVLANEYQATCAAANDTMERLEKAEKEVQIERILREDSQNHHTASMIELGRILGMEDREKEPRFKWVALQAASIKEQLEKAEAELARMREQKPLTWGTSGELMDILKNPIYSSPAPVPAVSDKRVDELAMLIRRLVRRLNQELPHNDIGEAAMDYLARNGISGEILRGWAAPAVPDGWLKCWLIERPASSEWPAIWLTITTDGRRWVSEGGTMYATGGDWYFTSAASEALKFAEKEGADEYVRHNKIKDVVVTEHIFDNRALVLPGSIDHSADKRRGKK